MEDEDVLSITWKATNNLVFINEFSVTPFAQFFQGSYYISIFNSEGEEILKGNLSAISGNTPMGTLPEPYTVNGK